MIRYLEVFTHEVFTVAVVKKTRPITYTLRDFNGEQILGSFYPNELARVDKSNPVFPIDSIIKRRRTRHGVELLVKWRGYNSSANSWVKERELYNLG